jgi:acetyl-CoA carboxylase carboxyltransferase component
MLGGRPEGKHFYCGPMRIARNWKGILQSKVDELKQKDEENARKDKELNRLSTLVGETQKEVYELRLKLSKVEKSKKVKG